IQPIDEVIEIIREYRSSELYLHVDAVQAVGKLNLELSNSEIDLLSLSSHKLHGPKGCGALYVNQDVRLNAQLLGGDQEWGYRAGTENVPGIVGCGQAVELLQDNSVKQRNQLQQLKERLATGLIEEIDNVEINGPKLTDSIPHILNLSVRGVKGEVLVHALEEDNIYFSTGSACSSQQAEPSHVLTAMGVDDQGLEGAVRFSLSFLNTIAEIDYTIERMAEVVPQLRKIMS
ncbi:MAG: cysteine desulfurase family protein, partial [Bacillota bacterium]